MEYPKGGAKMSGAVRISEFTYELIKHTHECEPKGELEVKGKGKLHTYQLMSRSTGMKAYASEEEEEYDDDIDELGNTQHTEQHTA